MLGEIRKELRRFAETTGIKGVGRVVKTTSKVIRFFWLISILICLGVLLFQVYTVMNNYTSHAVTRSSKVVQTKPTFPDVTICNLFPVYNISIASYKDYLETIEILKEYDLKAKIVKDSQLWTYLKSIEFYNANTPLTADFRDNRDGFVLECLQYGWDLYMPTLCETKVVVTTPLQKCHRIELNGTDSKVAAVSVVVFTNNEQSSIIDGYNSWIRMSTGTGARVMIHPKGTFPNPSSNIRVTQGNELAIQVRQTNVSRLQAPYGNCTDQQLLIPSQPDSPVYTTRGCSSLCRQIQMIDRCKCLDNNEIYTDEQFNLVNGTFCANITQTIKETPRLPDAVNRRLQMINCQTTFLDSEDANCNCLTPCSETYYSTGASSSQWPNPLYHLSFYKQFIQDNAHFGSKFSIYDEILKNAENQTDEETLKQIKSVHLIEENFLEVLVMFSEDSIEKFTDSPAATWDTLIANLGGSFNLWLGICVPTVAEIIELIYSLVLVICCKRKACVS